MLTFRAASVVRQGTALANPYLSERLADRRFGDWTISAQAMNFLEREIRARPPTRVLEFGSGLSTACLARYMAESAPDLPRPFLISVEEDASFCAESRKLITELGLGALASRPSTTRHS
jgi:predicted O-methyltransferase YrrM